jgi:DNA repair exonuclease SbcCD ATPase subunit
MAKMRGELKEANADANSAGYAAETWKKSAEKRQRLIDERNDTIKALDASHERLRERARDDMKAIKELEEALFIAKLRSPRARTDMDKAKSTLKSYEIRAKAAKLELRKGQSTMARKVTFLEEKVQDCEFILGKAMPLLTADDPLAQREVEVRSLFKFYKDKFYEEGGAPKC